MGALTGVFLRGADINQWFAEVVKDVVFIGPKDGVIAGDDGIVSGRARLHVAGEIPAFRHPFIAAAVEQPDIVVTEEATHPQGVGSPPVAFVSVEHDGVVAGDTFGRHQGGELFTVEVVAQHRVV